MSERPELTVSLRQTGPIPLNLDIVLRRSEMVALVGPSGAGKTTVLRSIAGLYGPRVGRVVCGGEVWLDTVAGVCVPPHRRRVGLVFQSYALFPHMTALGNIKAAMAHRRPQDRLLRARELMRLVHLDGLEDRRPAQLSGGQQQRVAVARALARDPAVLLLDEPFSAVDRPTRRQLHDELRALRAALAVPIVLVTHDLVEAAALADRLIVLDAGEVLQDGAPGDVLASPASDRVRHVLDLAPAGAAVATTRVVSR